MSKRRRPRAEGGPAVAAAEPCPCGASGTYAGCCGRLHKGEARATTAEQLMRSRYSAFVVRDEAYLLTTSHPSTRPTRIDFEPGLRWQRLEVLGGTDGTAFNTEGTVEFRAHYVKGGRAAHHHEISRFTRHQGVWVYLDGTTG